MVFLAVQENVRIGVLSVVVEALLLVIACLIWLHGRDIRIFKPILKLPRRPIGEVLIVFACVGGLVQHGATKGFFGGRG